MAATIQTKATPSYVFNLGNRNYYDGEKLISRGQIRVWISEANDNLRGKLKDIGEQFLSGKINNAQAELDALGLITKHHSSIAVIANGGREQMGARSWGRSGPIIKSERAYMETLWRDFGNGEVTDDVLLRRLQNYSDGSTTYENLFRAYAKDAGFDKEINVQSSSQPCSECDGLSALGAVEIGSLPDVGTRICNGGCGCSINIIGVDDVAA